MVRNGGVGTSRVSRGSQAEKARAAAAMSVVEVRPYQEIKKELVRA